MANDRQLNYEVVLTDKFSQEQGNIARKMRETQAETQSLKAAFVDLGKGMAGLAVAGLGLNAMRSPLRAASQMQVALLGVKAELLENGKSLARVNQELRALEKTAMTVQGLTLFDAAEILELEKELLKGGATLAQVAGDSGAAMASAMLAQYEGVIASYAGQGLISIATPFKLAGDQFAYLADQITRASAASMGGFEDFAEGAKYAAPMLSALNITVEDMLTYQAMLAQSKLQGSMGGTVLAAVFSEAARSGTFSSATLKSPKAFIDQLKEAVAGLDEVASINKLREMGFGDRSMRGVLSLLNQDFDAMRASMDGAAGLMDKVTISMGALSAQVASLKGSGRSTLGLIFQPALKPMSEFVSLANKAVGSIGDLVSKYPQLARFATAATGIGITTAGLYGGTHLIRGIANIPGGFRNVAGAAGSALRGGHIPGVGALMGVAKGKALEAATGVQSVYVTNQIDERKIAAATAAAGSPMLLGGRFTGFMRIIPMLGLVSTGVATLATALTMVNQHYSDKNAQAKDLVDNNLNYQLGLAKMIYSPTGVMASVYRKSSEDKATIDPWQADLLDKLPGAIKDVFTAANAEQVQLRMSEMTNFAMDYARYGASMWQNEDMMADYGNIYQLLQSDRNARIYLKIDMKQEQSPEGIKNKEFIINVASGASVKTSIQRGENIRSFSRNV